MYARKDRKEGERKDTRTERQKEEYKEGEMKGGKKMRRRKRDNL